MNARINDANESSPRIIAKAIEDRYPGINDEPVLWLTLRTKRPHGGNGIQTVMDVLQGLGESVKARSISRDLEGNLWIDTRTNPEDQSTMFQAHLDTVETEDGSIDIYMGLDGIVNTDGSTVLGADDGAGIGLLGCMIEANIPALYLFSQNEEKGGSGGKYAATKMKHMIKGVKRCIAFDRKGTKDICGEQFCGTLASKAFVSELSSRLDMGHTWDCGTYTDNSEFQGQIQEIVNISIGYASNHGPKETLDYGYYSELRDKCIKLDWESLPCEGPDTSSDYNGLSTYGYTWEKKDWYYPKSAPSHDYSYQGICKIADTTISVIDTELAELVDILGLDPSGFESDMILDSLTRAREDGIKEGKRIGYRNLRNDRKSRPLY